MDHRVMTPRMGEGMGVWLSTQAKRSTEMATKDPWLAHTLSHQGSLTTSAREHGEPAAAGEQHMLILSLALAKIPNRQLF